MGLIPILILIVLPVAFMLSYFISVKTYKNLKRKQSKYPRLIQVGVFLVSFAALLILGIYIVGNKIPVSHD